MFETALAQLRIAAAIVSGRRFHVPSFDRLIDGMRETQREFGELGSDAAELLGGPVLDESTRREVQLRRFRTQAVRGARETAYYGRLFERLGLDPARLEDGDLARIPPTPKAALRDDPDAFVRRAAQPVLRAMTTGTTGRPTSVAFSAYELQVTVALGAVGALFARRVTSEDVVHLAMSSRAILGNLALAGACARLGAQVYQAGLVEPAHALALLAEQRQLASKKPRASILATYPSYLGELVTRGLRLGYRPADFGLEHVFVGGEIVTAGLKARCRRLFGPVRFVESYGMTETMPFGGDHCSAGHLHFEPSLGLLEVQDPDTAAPAGPGEAGTVIATPFPPYRETTVLLRYDTRDVVRPLAGPLACDLRHLPATTDVLGKLDLAARHADGWTFQRDVLEALEAVEEVALPARYGFRAVPGGVAIEAVVVGDAAVARRAIARRLEEQTVPVRELRLVSDRRELRCSIPLRCDLREASFDTPTTGDDAVESATRQPMPAVAGVR